MFNGEFEDFTVPGIPSFGNRDISKELGKVTFNATSGSFSFKCYLKQGAEYLLSFDVSNKTPNYMISIGSTRVDYTASESKERITRRFISQGEDVIIVGIYGTMDKPSILSNFQIEEGTQATPYEPYQEHKLTILSPVPLEKVGDVADRIICKDCVWGVEKNICNEVFTIDDVSTVTFLDNVVRYIFRPRTGLVLNKNAINNYTNNFYSNYAYDGESWYKTGETVVVKRNKATVGDTEEKAKEYL